MATITFITDDDVSVLVEAQPGQTMMEAAVAADVEGILAECGGACSCATCHVILDERWMEKLGKPNPLEAGMLEFSSNAMERSRLCCQIDVSEELDGMVVKVGG